MPNVIVEEEAEDELLVAAIWYEERRVGLGREFLQEVTNAILRITERPALFPPLTDIKLAVPVRRALLHRFPYALVFVDRGDNVYVVAAAHAHREKNYWLYRITSQ